MGSLEGGRDELEILSYPDARGLAEESWLFVLGKLPFHLVEVLSQETRVAVGHDMVAEAKDAQLAVRAPTSLGARAGRRRAQRWRPASHQIVGLTI